jgi:hypothetical protein
MSDTGYFNYGIVGLKCGVVPACRQAGTGKKAGKSLFLSLP